MFFVYLEVEMSQKKFVPLPVEEWETGLQHKREEFYLINPEHFQDSADHEMVRENFIKIQRIINQLKTSNNPREIRNLNYTLKALFRANASIYKKNTIKLPRAILRYD